MSFRVLSDEMLEFCSGNANRIPHPEVRERASAAQPADTLDVDSQRLCHFARGQRPLRNLSFDPFRVQQGYSKDLPLTGIRLHRPARRRGLECCIYRGLHWLADVCPS
jgi:hypothetical protein